MLTLDNEKMKLVARMDTKIFQCLFKGRSGNKKVVFVCVSGNLGIYSETFEGLFDNSRSRALPESLLAAIKSGEGITSVTWKGEPASSVSRSAGGVRSGPDLDEDGFGQG